MEQCLRFRRGSGTLAAVVASTGGDTSRRRASRSVRSFMFVDDGFNYLWRGGIFCRCPRAKITQGDDGFNLFVAARRALRWWRGAVSFADMPEGGKIAGPVAQPPQVRRAEHRTDRKLLQRCDCVVAMTHAIAIATACVACRIVAVMHSWHWRCCIGPQLLDRVFGRADRRGRRCTALIAHA